VDEREPRRLVTLPRAIASGIVCLVLLCVVGAAAVGATADGTLTVCSMQNTKSRQTGIDFTFFPLGYDCVFLDPGGHEIGRVRAGSSNDPG